MASNTAIRKIHQKIIQQGTNGPLIFAILHLE